MYVDALASGRPSAITVRSAVAISGADDQGVHDLVVQRLVLLVPQRPQQVDDLHDEADPHQEAQDEELADDRAARVEGRSVDLDDADPERLVAERLAVVLARTAHGQRGIGDIQGDPEHVPDNSKGVPSSDGRDDAGDDTGDDRKEDDVNQVATNTRPPSGEWRHARL